VERSLPRRKRGFFTQRSSWGTVIRGLIGTGTTVDGLRQALDSSVVRSRDIANRVANASNASTASFTSSLAAASEEEHVDLEVEMVKLADEQIRYEAMTELLSKVYGQIRSSLRGS
jgi:flagellar basal body rod protein FlgB